MQNVYKKAPTSVQVLCSTGFCKFKERCAFAHRKSKAEHEIQKISLEVVKLKETIENLKQENCVSSSKESTIEDITNLKAEVDLMKNTINSIISIKKEGRSLKKSISELKEYIKYLRASNKDTANIIKTLQNDFEEESEDEEEEENLEGPI